MDNIFSNHIYDEAEMLKICKKYDIDIVEKEGAPLLCGKEMEENFSFSDLMRNEIQMENN